MNLGERIKQYRKKKGLTQKELAKLIDKSYSIVQKYELNLATPPIDVIEKISSALDIYPEQLIFLPRPSPEDMDISEIDNNDIPEEDWKEILKWNSEEETTYSIDELTKKFDMLNKRGKKKVYEYTNDICKIKEYTTPEDEPSKE